MTSRKKTDNANKNEGDAGLDKPEGHANPLGAQKGRQSEFAISRGGMNQESRQHNKAPPQQQS
jgi:hypothetical protein